MSTDKKQIKDRSPARDQKSRFDLETRLRQKVSLDTDVMNFFLIAGWNYLLSPIYSNGNNKLKESIQERYQKRRVSMETKMKKREGRFGNSIANYYFAKKIKTLRDLKKIIETEGLKYKDMGCLGLAEFNKSLNEYGIEPFKLRRKYWGEKTLKKYGVRPKDIYFLE